MSKTTRPSRRRARIVVTLVLFVPAILTTYFLKSAIWLIAIPIGITVLVMMMALLAGLIATVLDIKAKLTPQQFADRLEKHLLLHTENRSTDDTLPLRIADERLERLALDVYNLDLTLESDRDKVRAMIDTLRRGEVPETVPPTHLTYDR